MLRRKGLREFVNFLSTSATIGANRGFMKNLRSSYRVAGTLFFLSGALGLGYELIWIRKAALVVGASQIALSTVLTTFFLGLGLGGLVVGRHLRTARL